MKNHFLEVSESLGVPPVLHFIFGCRADVLRSVTLHSTAIPTQRIASTTKARSSSGSKPVISLGVQLVLAVNMCCLVFDVDINRLFGDKWFRNNRPGLHGKLHELPRFGVLLSGSGAGTGGELNWIPSPKITNFGRTATDAGNHGLTNMMEMCF